MNSRSREQKKRTSSKLRPNTSKEDLKQMSAFVGAHTKTHADQKNFIGGMLRIERRNSRDTGEKHLELRKLLHKSSLASDFEHQPKTVPKSKLFSNLKQSKLALSTNYSNVDKSHLLQSGSKEVLSKVKHLFATKSTEKAKTKLRRSKEKKPHGRSIEESRKSRGESLNNSRDPSKASRTSAESRPSKERIDPAVKKLTKFYDSLCNTVDCDKTSHDDKITAISSLFAKFLKLTEYLDKDRHGPACTEERDIRQKILSFFTFYSKMNAKAYTYTRKLVSDSLGHVEKMIIKERDALLQFTPQYFSSLESVDLEEAVLMVVDFAQTLVEQNRILSGYIRKNIGDQKVEDLLTQKKNNSILNSLMPRRSSDQKKVHHTESSLSNMEKENDLNMLYETSSPYRPEDDFEIESHAKVGGSTFGNKLDYIDTSKTPMTNKLGFYNNPEANLYDEEEYEYSETSKKKPFDPLARKKSRSINAPSKDSWMGSKDKNTFPPKSTKDTWPKKSLGLTQKFDDQSRSNLIEDDRRHQLPALDLRLRLGK